MKFLQKTLIPSGQLLYCSCIRQKQSTLDALLFYCDRIEYLSLKTDNGMQCFTKLYCLPITERILWAAVGTEYIFMFTDSFQIIICNVQIPFRQKRTIELVRTDKKLKHFAQSCNGCYVCFSEESNRLMYMRIDDKKNWYVEMKILNVEKILDIVNSVNDCSFYVMVNDENGKKIIEFDPETGDIDEIKKIDDEIIGLIKSENLSYYSENTIFVDEERYEVDSRIISKPFTINNNIMCFLDNGNLFCLNVESNKIKYFTDGINAKKCFVLSQASFICFGDHTSIVFVKIPNFNLNSFLDYKTLIISHSIKNNLYASNNNNFLIINGNNLSCLNYNNEHEEKQIEEFENSGKLFSNSNELVLFSDSSSTYTIINRKKAIIRKDQRTINFIRFKKKIYQIFEKEIYNAGKLEREFEDSLICTDSAGNSAVAVTDKNEILLFTRNFKEQTSSFVIELDGAKITAGCITSNFIVVAAFEEEKKINGQLFVLDYDLNSFGEYSLPSPCISFIKQNDDETIYGICKNNSIFKIHFSDKELSPISYVYYGKNILDAYYFSNDKFLIIDDYKLYVFYKDQIIWTGISNAISACKHDSSIIYVDKNNKILSREFDLTNSLTIIPYKQFNEVIKQIIFFDNYKLILLVNSIELYKGNEFISKIDSISAISIVTQKIDDKYMIYILHSDNINVSVFQYKDNEPINHVYTQSFKENISQILLLENLILFVHQRYIQISQFSSNMFVFDKLRFESDDIITKADVFDNYLWIISQNSKINIFNYNRYYSKFEIIAQSIETFNITTFSVIDRLTAIIGERNGKISSIIIPNGASHGFYKQFDNKIAKTKTQPLFNAHDSITFLSSTDDYIIYGTKHGRVGILSPIKIEDQFQAFQQIQNKLHNQFNEKYNLKLNEYSENSTIDYDFFESFQDFISVTNLDSDIELINSRLLKNIQCLLKH